MTLVYSCETQVIEMALEKLKDDEIEIGICDKFSPVYICDQNSSFAYVTSVVCI